MMLRIRSRDGLERVKIDNPNATIDHLKSLIESELRVPIQSQILSTNQNLLLAKTLEDVARFTDMSNPRTLLSSLNLTHGSIVYLAYEGERTVAGAPPVTPAGSFGKKMTMDDLIAKQMRITRQENPHCELISFDRDSANAFQHYVNETLAFAVKRGGLMYGTVSPEGKVEVNFIYEPPQQGTEDNLLLMRDPDEERIVEALALGFGMRRVGFIFTQTISQDKKDYTMSNKEILQAAELQAEGDLKEWVTAVVKMEVNEEDGSYNVHFEAFQMSDLCIKLFKEEWFEKEVEEGADPKLSKMNKDVVVGGKDTREVDNDFFLVVVKIADHQGPLSSTFPIENRMISVTMGALKSHLNQSKNLPYWKRIADFHLLLLVARYLDVNGDVPALAECVRTQSAIPEGYQLLIESMASTG
ncbi:OLC1v1007482C1 [Oldenlandia corymbosa var. corymbosa]|uniref:OLC1v1007482C1 n=1 Tax=Oldenlandia corymbosa var. corymbosa TaxID=529605 RepID=A0AAV1DJE2_OLDCO|nr:OLC1v1007482C1 [Oldenlandia corymbosa var. corymbosa]